MQFLLKEIPSRFGLVIIICIEMRAGLDKPRGAQAVGQALAANPFPIIIPCHRTVASNGSLFGFRGGRKLKRILLETEGITFLQNGRVDMKDVWY